MTKFNVEEAELLVPYLERAVVLLPAAIERVRELEDERDEMAPIISRAYELEHRLAAAEKVIEAARQFMPLDQALQDYDRD